MIKRYWDFKDEALDRNLLRIRLGRGYMPVVRRTPWWWASPSSHHRQTFSPHNDVSSLVRYIKHTINNGRCNGAGTSSALEAIPRGQQEITSIHWQCKYLIVHCLDRHTQKEWVFLKTLLHDTKRTSDFTTCFDVLLTVHLSIILVINQLNAQILVIKQEFVH